MRAAATAAAVLLCHATHVFHIRMQTAAAADVASSLKAKGFNSFAALLDVANMTKALNNPAAVYTVMA
jgi:hypothetical protein